MPKLKPISTRNRTIAIRSTNIPDFAEGKLFPRLSILNLVRKVKKKGLELEATTYSTTYEDIVLDVIVDEKGEPKQIAVRKVIR